MLTAVVGVAAAYNCCGGSYGGMLVLLYRDWRSAVVAIGIDKDGNGGGAGGGLAVMVEDRRSPLVVRVMAVTGCTVRRSYAAAAVVANCSRN